MLLPNKVLDVSNSMLYKALNYYYKYEDKEHFIVNTYEDVEFLTILYGLGYIKCTIQSSLGGKDEIKVFKSE